MCDFSKLERHPTPFMRKNSDDMVKSGEIPKEAKYVILQSDKDDNEPFKIEVRWKNKRAYFVCPSCGKDKRLLAYPTSLISYEYRRWLCDDCCRKPESLYWDFLCNPEELKAYEQDNTQIPNYGFIPLSPKYKTTMVNSKSFRKVAFDIEDLFMSVGIQLPEDQMNTLLGWSNHNGKVIQEKPVSLSYDYKTRLSSAINGDKVTNILWNYFRYRDAIINKEIKYYSLIAEYARKDKYYRGFSALLETACLIYQEISKGQSSQQSTISKSLILNRKRLEEAALEYMNRPQIDL